MRFLQARCSTVYRVANDLEVEIESGHVKVWEMCCILWCNITVCNMMDTQYCKTLNFGI